MGSGVAGALTPAGASPGALSVEAALGRNSR